MRPFLLLVLWYFIFSQTILAYSKEKVICTNKQSSECHYLGSKALDSGDLTKAREYFEIGCNANDEMACATLEFTTQKGQQKLVDSCLIGDGASCTILPKDFFIKKESEYILNKLKKECTKGIDRYCRSLHRIYSRIEKQSEISSFLKDICSQIPAAGCLAAGYTFKELENWTSAISMFKNGCQAGELLACSNLVSVYSRTKEFDKAEVTLKDYCRKVPKNDCDHYTRTLQRSIRNSKK